MHHVMNKLMLLTCGCWLSGLAWAQAAEGGAREAHAQIVVDVIGQAPVNNLHLYACRKDGVGRRVEIHYPIRGQQVPCEVNYFKDDGVLEQYETLWYAEHQAGYCEQQAQDLVDRLVAAGWQCED